MPAQVLDGIATAAVIKAELAARVSLITAAGRRPGLGTVLVGDDPGSRAYVAAKHRDCAEVGIDSIRVDLPATASMAEVLDAVRALNHDPAVTGYIVQLPLPAHLDESAVLAAIDPAKDADGLHPENLGRLVSDISGRGNAPVPCTPAGIVELLRRYQVPLAGSRVTVVGRGLTVGRGLGLLLTQKGIDATVTLAHSHTRDLAAETRRAEIVVAAVGVAHLVSQDWIAPGAAVLDVGVSRLVDSHTGAARLVGDVAPGVSERAGWLSPNPGGVGPMTRVMLLANVVKLAERHS